MTSDDCRPAAAIGAAPARARSRAFVLAIITASASLAPGAAFADGAAAAVSGAALANGRAALGRLPKLDEFGADAGGYALDFGDANGSASFDYKNYDLGRSERWGVWALGGLNLHGDPDGVARYMGGAGYTQLGAEYEASGRLRLGVLMHGDLGTYAGYGTGSQVDGRSILAGPYAALEFYDDVVLEAMAWGGVNLSTLQDAAGAEADYLSGMSVATARLSGVWRGPEEKLWVRPSVRGSYFIEQSPEFAVDDETVVHNRTVGLTELRFGPEIGYQLEGEMGALQPFMGLEGVAAAGAGAASTDAGGVSAAASAGFEASVESAKIRFKGVYSGLGDEGAGATSGTFDVTVPLPLN